MSFGFAVGDFVAVGKLISDITSCLQSVGGAKSEYQELIREFQSLNAALRHLDQLESRATTSRNLDAIKCAALSCRHPLEEFLTKIRKYEKSLGIWSRSSAASSTADKLRWTSARKDEIRRLQAYLNVHIGTINILLAEHGLERMDLMSNRAEAESAQVRDQLDSIHAQLEDVKDSLPTQALLLRNVHSTVGGLFKLICGDMRTSLGNLSQMISRVCVSTQQIYTIVLEIRDSMAAPDTRWTYFQAPFVIEDALGFKFPIPSEYDYDMMDAIIRHRFKEGAGSQYVIAGNYELCKTNEKADIITSTSPLVPGTAITMAVIIGVVTLDFTIPTSTRTNISCPKVHCQSIECSRCLGGGFTCLTCNAWFDATIETIPKFPLSKNDHDQYSLRNVKLALEDIIFFPDGRPGSTVDGENNDLLGVEI